jgi:hypothetical protein
MTSSLPFAAQAADPTDGKSGSLAVEKMICSQSYVHQAAPDTAFQPGVDAQGNPVVPADVGVAPMVVPDYFEVPLTADLATRLGQPSPEGVEMNATIGNLRLYKTGRVEFNGQDMTAAASILCGGNIPAEAPLPQGTPMTAPVAPTVRENTIISPDVPVPGGVALSATVEPQPPRILWPGGRVPESMQQR